MNRNSLKKISLGLILSFSVVTFGQGVHANAAVTNQSQTLNVQSSISESLVSKVEQTITVTKDNVIFDSNKALKLGFSQDQVNRLASIYNEINNGIKNKTISVVNKNGNYDISITNSYTGSHSLKSYSQSLNSVSTQSWLTIYCNSTQCGDAAAILAGTAGTAAAVAGALGLTGVGIPAAFVLTIAAAIIGMGSAYLWVCSNHGGLIIQCNPATGDFWYHKLYND